MKNWLKNLLFVIFSFIFLGVGILIANIFIREKGNPLKDPNFLVDNSVDSTTLTASLPIDSTDGWLGDTVQVPEPVAKQKPIKEVTNESPIQVGDYDVVIGIFGERSNTNRQLKKLKDLGFGNAYSYSKSTRSVVSAGRFTKIEAQRIASGLQNKGFDAIVKHR
jgi:hypothetical protein